MNWFARNAGAIQAIASIVGVVITGILAAITYWYVRVTRDIAQSSVEQVRQMRDAAQVVEQQARAKGRQLAEALQVLASRTRASVVATEFTYAGLRVFTQPTHTDISDLEVMYRQLGNSAILYSGNRAVIALRHVLLKVESVKAIKKEIGWIPTTEESQYWKNAVDASAASLREIEDECTRVLKVSSKT